jgi:F-type H+-transporting ATPase subunit epsilon
MENKLLLDIVTPYGKVLSEEVDEVTTTGSEGEFGVLPGHVNFVTTLQICVLSYRKGDVTKYAFVNSGYAEVTPESVVVLADSAELADAIDADRALEAKKRAEERLRQEEKIDVARATAALQRATIRTQLAGKK